MKALYTTVIFGGFLSMVACNQSTTLVDDPLESDFMTVTFKGAIGDSTKDGVNVSTEWRPGTGTGKSAMRFYGITKEGKEIEFSTVANLAQRTVEIEMTASDTLKVFSHSGATHFNNNSAREFAIGSPTDFKISLNFKGNSSKRFIVGEEDGRPAIQELFTATDITFDSTNPKRVRISYAPDNTDRTKGILKISSENTSVGVKKHPCLPDTSGVPNRGWGLKYGKACPHDD
jgi:hypothetical protein